MTGNLMARAEAGAASGSFKMKRSTFHLFASGILSATLFASGLPFALVMTSGAHAQPAPAYESWPLLAPEFPSTGGGGVMIKGYEPVVAGGRCATDFQAVLPDGAIYRNEVAFDAVPASGGVLCTNGKWRAKDGSAEGTTPFEVFIKDGVRRMKP
jgi:hypothetical protein